MSERRSMSAGEPPVSRHAIKAARSLLTCLLLATAPFSIAQSATLKACTANELGNAITSAKPGDFIEMCNRSWDNTEIHFDVDGTKDAPIRLVAESPGKVTLTGSSRLLVSGNFAIVDGLIFSGVYTGQQSTVIELRSVKGRNCDDCRLTNISVIGYNPADASKFTQWVVLHGKRNRLDHSHFKGKNNLGSMVQVKRGADQTPNNHRIDHNLLEDRPDFTGDGNQNGDTLEIGSTGKFSHGMSGTDVEFNYIRNVDSDFELITVKSSGNTVQYNVIESSRGVLSLRQGSGNVVHGNFIMGRGKDRTGGIRVRGKDHVITSNYISDVNPSRIRAYSALMISDGTDEIVDIGGEGTAPYLKFARAENARILNNTVANSGISMTFGTGDLNPPTDIDLSNNILVQPSGDAIINLGMGPNITFSNNLFFGDNLGINVSGIFEEDPQLVADSAEILRPTPQSPALDAVWTISSVDRDMDGQSRSTPYDIGADEVIDSESPRGMIPLCAVGPRTYRKDLPIACDGASYLLVARPLRPTSLIVE